MGQTLNLKSGAKVLASIRIMNRRTGRSLIHILHENTVRFVGSENGEIYFEIMNQTEFYITIDVLNTNNDNINKIDLLRPYGNIIIIERNEVLGCLMILEEYVTDRGQPLMYHDEKSRCLGKTKIGFDLVFGTSYTWEVDYCWIRETFGGFQTVVTDRTRTETDGGGFQTVVCNGRRRIETDSGGIVNTSRALLRAGRALEQVRFKETIANEKFYAHIKYDFGIFSNKNSQTYLKKGAACKNHIRCKRKI